MYKEWIYCCPTGNKRNPWLQTVQCNVLKTFESYPCSDWRINDSGFFLGVFWTMFPFLCIFFLSRLLREQWIRAKYERKEFIHSEKQEPYSAGSERHFWQMSFLMSSTFHFLVSVYMFFILIIACMSLIRRRKCVLLERSLLAFPVWLVILGNLKPNGNKWVFLLTSMSCSPTASQINYQWVQFW